MSPFRVKTSHQLTGLLLKLRYTITMELPLRQWAQFIPAPLSLLILSIFQYMSMWVQVSSTLSVQMPIHCQEPHSHKSGQPGKLVEPLTWQHLMTPFRWKT